MAKTSNLQTIATRNLNRRKVSLLVKLSVPPDVLRASSIKQFVTCGKANCRCHRGHKHGPFNYLVQCLRGGKIRKFLLKTGDQQAHARAGAKAYVQFQKRLEQLSLINTELLRRGELLRQ